MAVVPNWFFTLTCAPALISARAISTSPFDAAHMIGVVPSGPATFASAPLASSASTAARFPCSTASSSGVAAEAATAVASHMAMTAQMEIPQVSRTFTTLISQLRENAAAVADFLHRDVVSVEQRHEQVGESRILRIFHVLTALDASVRVPENCCRQRVVVVLVAVAHVAAEQNRRM